MKVIIIAHFKLKLFVSLLSVLKTKKKTGTNFVLLSQSSNLIG